jgi:tRNA-splicing ligase RtcB (3'-phosphate/5'-hydroxy nucleic acid ligase)
MFELTGKYASAKIFTDKVEESAQGQIINLLNQPFVAGAKIRIMSDIHMGVGCVIGFTADLKDMVIPNLIGVDIGCGMLCIDITGLYINLDRIDKFIHENIPSGRYNNEKELTDFNYHEISCLGYLKNQGSFGKAIGSLGGGNHFIEINESNKYGEHYLVIHSGSRNLGKQVADFYQNLAIEEHKGSVEFLENREFTIRSLKDQGRQNEIQRMLKEMDIEYSQRNPPYPRELCFLTGESMQAYLHDMKICQDYARMNRYTMAKTILNFLDTDMFETNKFETVHNYINFEDGIMRKGAVSAKKDERLIIPINMRDGSLLCVGKGNSDWNQSAPHGAGRLMSRHEAKRRISMDDYQNSMNGVYTSCVTENNLD